MKEIFGAKGLLHQNNVEDFDEMSYKLSEKYLNELPEFTKYFDDTTVTLKEFVFRPVKDDRVPENWKNNGCESMNHIIKLTGSWKKSNLCDLVERLYRIIRLQYDGVKKALHGQGDFQLAAEHRRFRVSDAVWRQKTEEKDKLVKKFLSTKSCSREKAITSSDGLLILPPDGKLA